jgi:hypothetical protein
MRSTADNSVVEMDIATAMQGMATFIPGSSEPLYKPVSAIPGFLFRDDGGVIPTTFDPEQAVRVAQNQGKAKYPYRLAFGKNDPAFAAAKVYKEDQILRRIGENQPWGKVAAERAADIVTFGAYGAIKDDDERESQIRAYQNLYHPWATAAGTLGGVAVGLLFPYGKMATVLGKGAMAAGGASGIARAARTGYMATNLVQVSARASAAAREAVKGGLFMKNLAGGMAATAVSEAPLSLAIAAADIVDYNKEFSMQALVADAGSLYLLGVGIGFPIAVIGGGARSLLGAARRGGEKATASKALDIAAEYAEGVARRASYMGTKPWEGVAKYNIARRGIRWFHDKLSSRGAKMLTGELVDDLYEGSRTFRSAAQGLDITSSTATAVKQVDDLRSAISALKGASVSPDVASWLDDLHRNAAGVVNAKESLFVLQKNIPLYQTELSMIRFKPPKKVPFVAKAYQEADAALRNVSNKLLTEAEIPGPMGNIQAKVAGEIGKIREVLGNKSGHALTKMVEARELVAASQLTGKGQYIEMIDEAIGHMTNKDMRVMDSIHQIELMRKNIGELAELYGQIGELRNFTGGVGSAERMKTLLEPLPTISKNLGFRKEVYDKLVNDHGVMQQKTTFNNVDQFAKLNMARKSILQNEGAGFDAFLNRPMGPGGPLTFGDELLDSQIQTVMHFKMNTAKALRFLTLGGSPRGAAWFGGVLTYRALTEEEKRTEFESAREVVLDAAASPERLIGVVGKTSGIPTSTDMVAGMAYATTLTTAASYLQQQLPKSGDPAIGPKDFSMEEIDSYLETIGALDSPASVLATARDGSVSLEGVDAVRTVYPELYTDMVLDLIEFMQSPSWAKLTEDQKLGLDTFTGGALGVLQSWGPMPGPLFAQTPMQQQALGKNMQQASPDMARMQAQRTTTSSQKVSGL